MHELSHQKRGQVHETLLVVDPSMTGEALNIAQGFHKAIPVTD
jgi:signal recognition particle GTPase